MQYIFRRKVASFFICLFLSSVNTFGQLRGLTNLPEHDDKPYHFGINLGYNQSHFSITHHPMFLQTDTILDVESISSSGINLAFLVNLRMGDHFDLRLHPLDLTFSEKELLYIENYTIDTSLVDKKVQSITLSFPVQVKYSSDRIDNFKVYTIAGLKFDYDLASNAGARKAEDLIKLNKSDISVEVGMGFHFYFPVFVLTPEIKLSSGITNLHSRDPNLRYSNVIDKINSKMVTFSLTVE